MAGEERAVFTNMCMIYDDDGNVLVQDRIKNDWSGVTFPGGHVEPKESFVSSVIREVKEETGLNIENPVLCGIKQFQTKSGARYIVLFYKTNKFSGELVSSDEGRVFWIKRSELESYCLADDFADMVKVFESDDLSEFYYCPDECGERPYKLL